MGLIMENLINNKFYDSAEEIEKKLNVFFAYNIITQDEYTKLMQLAESKYALNTDITKDSNTTDEVKGAI
ncbi:hypothetical protein [Clostridium saccharoperbutylacetonicum]|uniref:hypothetical protein n=1 Tax=Clostridium saccharoperbutylacetonicum TaxID=36745 RepID=UPI000983EAB6|nr:hypothetical protein [Clostridium saccharoperbutylacetonicum]AQR93493.1 hypothetical protein CLSAP_07990 [Clostridium saccharoperbutylacetonicum]NSB29191.1 hypothetical protein [Clostridium saccharoperbutylacetonicum]